MKNIAVFILTHGRPINQKTLRTLRKLKYKGDIFFVCDTEDNSIDDLQEKFPDIPILLFDKDKIQVDKMDNFNKQNCVVFARNACPILAKEKGYKYYLQLDDDYEYFSIKDKVVGKDIVLRAPGSFDFVVENVIKFLESTPTVKCVALSQGGDFIGGINSSYAKKEFHRKVMNSFFCRTDNPPIFMGTINEDVNYYTNSGIKGEVNISISRLSLLQTQTQQNKGGLTDIYLDLGTFVKSYYSAMISPSCVKVKYNKGMGRLHHEVRKNNAYVKILKCNA